MIYSHCSLVSGGGGGRQATSEKSCLRQALGNQQVTLAVGRLSPSAGPSDSFARNLSLAGGPLEPSSRQKVLLCPAARSTSRFPALDSCRFL